MKLLRRGLVAALFIGLLWVCLEFIRRNEAPVTVNLLMATLEGVVLWKVLAGACGIGAGIVSLLLAFSTVQSRMETRRYRKAVRALEAEVHQLRNLPLVGGSESGAEPMLVTTGGGSGGG